MGILQRFRKTTPEVAEVVEVPVQAVTVEPLAVLPEIEPTPPPVYAYLVEIVGAMDLGEKLNELGADSWELMAILPTGQERGRGQELRLVLKRGGGLL